MTKSPAYVLGALDVLVKAGEVSPAFAAGVASVLTKDAQAWYHSNGLAYTAGWNPFDSEAENVSDQWKAFINKNPGAMNAQTGQYNINGDQAKRVVDKAIPVWDRSYWNNVGANIKHWGRMASNLNPFSEKKKMTAEESRQLREDEYNQNRQDFMVRTKGEANPALYGALQDQFVRDRATAWHTAGNFMSDAERAARFGGEDLETAKNKMRTVQGTAAMQGGTYKPVYDTQSAQPKTKSIQNNPLSSMYGSKDRQRLYSGKFRNGLGMF